TIVLYSSSLSPSPSPAQPRRRRPLPRLHFISLAYKRKSCRDAPASSAMPVQYNTVFPPSLHALGCSTLLFARTGLRRMSHRPRAAFKIPLSYQERYQEGHTNVPTYGCYGHIPGFMSMEDREAVSKVGLTLMWQSSRAALAFLMTSGGVHVKVLHLLRRRNPNMQAELFMCRSCGSSSRGTRVTRACFTATYGTLASALPDMSADTHDARLERKGEIPCRPDIQVGTFDVGVLKVQDFIVVDIFPPGPPLHRWLKLMGSAAAAFFFDAVLVLMELSDSEPVVAARRTVFAGCRNAPAATRLGGRQRQRRGAIKDNGVEPHTLPQSCHREHVAHIKTPNPSATNPPTIVGNTSEKFKIFFTHFSLGTKVENIQGGQLLVLHGYQCALDHECWPIWDDRELAYRRNRDTYEGDKVRGAGSGIAWGSSAETTMGDAVHTFGTWLACTAHNISEGRDEAGRTHAGDTGVKSVGGRQNV
ncbi:hypothetical protein FB451DRAFT_1519091, partial [Mycena latifolia]